ncbi:hypothetical protein [Hephaestia caeni]|nr:hypothetical protein [Hephaestia caeni]
MWRSSRATISTPPKAWWNRLGFRRPPDPDGLLVRIGWPSRLVEG